MKIQMAKFLSTQWAQEVAVAAVAAVGTMASRTVTLATVEVVVSATTVGSSGTFPRTALSLGAVTVEEEEACFPAVIASATTAASLGTSHETVRSHDRMVTLEAANEDATTAAKWATWRATAQSHVSHAE